MQKNKSIEPILKIENLHISFINDDSETVAVKNISLHVNRGEMLAIVGESGSGKSVTALSILKLIRSNAIRINSGKIFFSKNNSEEYNQVLNLLAIPSDKLKNIRGNRIAMIFQEPMTSLNPVMRCGDQVMESILTHNRVSRHLAKRKVLDLFNKVRLPDPELTFRKYPHQLSGGQKQRVMIAMAMSCHPDLLICDEPTTALDASVQNSIVTLIRELQQHNNMGVVFITHDLELVEKTADRVAVMYKGEIVEQAPANEIFSRPRHPYTKALLACRPSLFQKGTRLPVVKDFFKPDLNTSEKSNFDTTEVFGKNLMLDVKNLSVKFPVRKNIIGKTLEWYTAVNDVSFQLYKGETVGLTGESGCGKTTLGRAIMRLVTPAAGEIWFRGENIVNYTNQQMRPFRKNMQMIFQDPYSSLNPQISIGDAIAEPLVIHQLVKDSREAKERVINLLQKVGLKPEYYHRYPHEFSGGQRQRIGIARALVLEPELIICDESVSALDVSVQAQVLNLLNDLKSEFGFTSLFISHDMNVVRYMSDRILRMEKGSLDALF